MRAINVTEHGEQVAVIEWARTMANTQRRKYSCLRWLFAIPNGAKLPYRKTRTGKRYSPQAIRLLAEGLTPGVSDLFLPHPSGSFCGLYIEMKVGNNKITSDQKEFLDAMNKEGYLAVVCYSADQAIMTLKAYIDYG